MSKYDLERQATQQYTGTGSKYDTERKLLNNSYNLGRYEIPLEETIVEQPKSEYENLSALGKIKRSMTGYVPPKEYLDKVETEATQRATDFAKSKGGSFELGFLDSATLGATSRNNEFKPMLQTAEETNPITTNIGKVGGYISPGALSLKATKPITNVITKGFGEGLSKRIIEGGIAGAPIDVIQGLMEGDNAKELAGRAGRGFILGAAGDTALYGLGKAGSKLLPKILKRPTADAPKTPIEPLKQIDNINTYNKVESPLKTSLDESAATMNEAIEPLKFSTNVSLPKRNPLNPLPDTTSKIVSSQSKKSVNDIFSTAYRRIVDTNSPIKKVGGETYTLATNSKNVGGTVDYILQEGLATKSGKTIGKSLKDVAKDIPKGQETKFWDYMLHKHNINRAAQEKNVFLEYTPEMSAQKVAEYEKQFPQFQKPSKEVRNFMDKFMEEWGNKTGLVSDELMQDLKTMYPDYIPTQRAFDEIEKDVVNFGKRGFVDQSSPIKKAKGSDRDIINPLENIMNQVNKTVRTAKYNEVGQSLLDTVMKSPNKMKQFAEVIPGNEGIFSNSDNVVTVMVQGKPIYLKINDMSLLESMKGLYSSSPGDIEKAAKKVTGIFKSLITQKNPLFALRNIARDIPTAYVYGNEKNPLKFGKDLLSAGKDLVTNSATTKQYRAIGGGGANFFKANDIAKSADQLIKGKGIIGKIGDGIELFNNLTESTPRLAEFKRILKETGDANKALFGANDVTTNFSRGGDITKSADSFIPYLNAGIQGLDKLARSLDPRNPKQALATLIKGGIAITVPTAFFDYINKDNPSYQDLDNRTKDNYFLIPNGETFIKIPKSRELGVLFGSLFERIGRQARGDSEAWKGFGGKDGTVATNFSPANPIEDNILSAYQGLKSNKDFAGRTIVPQSMQDLSPRYQYDEKTSEIAKKIGDMADLSPKQIDYIIRSYTGVIGQLGLPATTKGGDITKTITNQFTSDPVYSNQVITDFYDNYDKLKTAAADKNFTQKLPSKLITPEEIQRNNFAKASDKITDLNKQIRAIQQGNDANKEEKMRQLRKQIIDIAKYANNK